MAYTSWSSPLNSETIVSCDGFQRCHEHKHFEKCSGNSTTKGFCNNIAKKKAIPMSKKKETAFLEARRHT